MGVYDTIVVGSKEGQVKVWDGGMGTFSFGDTVPSVLEVRKGESTRTVETYSIAMREGGYVNVFENSIHSWTDDPRFPFVVDKWGSKFTEESEGLLGEDYFFGEDEDETA